MEPPRNSIKILVVGEAASIHTAKYVSMLQKAGYDVRLFSNSQNTYQDGLLKNTLIYRAAQITHRPANGNIFCVPFLTGTLCVSQKSRDSYYKLLRILRHRSHSGNAHHYLNRVIAQWKPALVISLKMQDDGYVMTEARVNAKGPYPPWAHFIWGTDIEFFGKAPEQKEEHLPKIKKLLAHCDYLIADTYRDLDAAQTLGFKGIVLGKQIAQGGFDMGFVFSNNHKTFDERKIIIVKGRQGGYIGKGMNVLEALHGLKDSLHGFEIKIIMATPDVRERAAQYSKTDGINYECLDKIDYSTLMDLFANARVAISATDVDGTPGFLLESMAMGALPVHSDMASIREWIDHGQNGLLFPVDDIEVQKSMILRALTDEKLFNAAQEKNKMAAREKMDEKIITKQTEDMIRTILSGSKSQESKKAV